jgi:hypothetical protein
MHKIFQPCFDLFVSHGIPQHYRATAVLFNSLCRRTLMIRALPQLSTTQRYRQLLYNVPQVYMAHSVFYSNITFVAPLSLLFIYQQNFPVVHVGEYTGTNFVCLVNGFT